MYAKMSIYYDNDGVKIALNGEIIDSLHLGLDMNVII